MDTNKLKKKILTLIIGLGTLLGVVSAAKYDNPSELIEDQLEQEKASTIEETVKVQTAGMSAIGKVPAIIKSLLLLPFWGVGFIILNLLDKVIKLVGLPLLSFLLSWLFLFLILLIIIVSFIKLLYPNLSLKQIITKRLVISLLICSLLMTIADRLLLGLYSDYESIRKIIRFVLGFVVLICLTFDVIKKKISDERKAKGIYVVEWDRRISYAK